jgi:NAD(P)-dependent dehydrogenase (short-subunit alcohol dehydrogenase family)
LLVFPVDSSALAGKSLVVVGASSGLGLSATRACLKGGASVVAVAPPSAPTDALCGLASPALQIVHGDARDPQTAQLAVVRAVEAFGALHGLYHVAGGSGRALGDGVLHEITDTGWDETLRWNLTSLFYSNRAATARFLEQRTAGSVLNLGSVLGSSPSPRFFGTHAYAAAKAAIVGLTLSAAATYAARQVRFNVITPGLVETPMSSRALASAPTLEFIHAKQPLDGGRPGVPADLDAAVVFFLSDASRFVTGQVLAVDGGWTVTDAAAEG